MPKFTAHLFALPTLVRFDCGCVGFPPDGEGNSLVVWHCDSYESPYSLGFRNYASQNKRSAPKAVSETRAAEILADLADLVSKGLAHNELAGMLRGMIRD